MDDNVNFVLEVLSGTPWWVWAILVYILIVGIKSCKRGEVSLYRLFLLPVILFALRYKVLFQGGVEIWGVYLVSLGLGVLVGYFMAHKDPIKIIKDTTSIELPGSPEKLILLLAFFAMKYVFGYMQAVYPEQYLQWIPWEMGLNGLIPGFFLGKAINYAMRYFRYQRQN